MRRLETFRILRIRVDTGSFEIDGRPDLRRDYLGGIGAACALLREEVLPGRASLDPEQPVIFAIGPLNGLVPMASKTCAVFKSPLTEELGESYAGMRLGEALHLCGLDAVVLTGRSPSPVHISISKMDAALHEAGSLRGMSPAATEKALREAHAPGPCSTVVVGSAGEKGVSFACATVDRYRHFGRLGLGAVLGSRNIKGISVCPLKRESAHDFRAAPLLKEIAGRLRSPEIRGEFRSMGTLGNLPLINTFGGLPTENLSRTRMEGADDLSPEAFSRDVIKRKASCAGCPVGCIQVGRGVSIDYEPVYALGPLLGIKDREAVTALLRRTEDLGLDAMTAGVILSWLTEAYARGAVSRAEVIESPLFGDGKTYLRMLNHLVEWPGDLYRAMALDPLEEVKRRGGEDYFLSIQGVGLAAYHTGYGSLLGQVIGMRHSHLDNGGASLDRKFPDLDDGEIVEKLMAEERVRCLLSSMVLCLFGRKVFTPEAIASCLDAAGLPRDLYETHEAAARIYSLKLELKRLLGYDFSALRVPSRCFEVPSATGMLDRKRLERLNALFVERAGL